MEGTAPVGTTSAGIILGGRRVRIPGVNVITYLDDPATCPPAANTNPRRDRIRAIVCHTVEGRMGPISPGLDPAASNPRAWMRGMNRSTEASFDFLVARNGNVYQSNDPVGKNTWHAQDVNRYTLGIEMEQDVTTGETNEGQYVVELALIDALTALLGIPRQIPWYDGESDRRVFSRLRPEGGAGRDVYGIYGHRNQTDNKGRGDPGDHLWEVLSAAGYMKFDFVARADLEAWKVQQRRLGVTPVDGLPGPATIAALVASGVKAGMTVPRPFDATLPAPMSRAKLLMGLGVLALTAAGAAWWYSTQRG